MRNPSLTGIGAVCALLAVVMFVLGVVFMASSGVQVLIPETGAEGLEWIADVQGAGDLFFVGAWLAIFGGLFVLAALLGFYDALRAAGAWLVIAPIAAVVGLTLVTISHVVPVAMAYELAPGYSDADETIRETLASLSLLTNYVGNALGWGVAVPLYGIAILKTSVVPRWIGWLGLIVAVFAGWLGLLAPAWSALEALSAIGFVGFFVFLASVGIALLLRGRRASVPEAPTVPA